MFVDLLLVLEYAVGHVSVENVDRIVFGQHRNIRVVNLVDIVRDIAIKVFNLVAVVRCGERCLPT